MKNDEIYSLLQSEECAKFNRTFEKQNNRNCSSQKDSCESLYIIKERINAMYGPCNYKAVNWETSEEAYTTEQYEEFAAAFDAATKA